MTRVPVAGFPPDLQSPPSPEMAPQPFTPAAIRDAMKPGSRRRFITRGTAGTTTIVEWSVLEATEAHCRIRFTLIDDDGSPGAPTEKVVGWEELRDHATFPAAHTTAVEEEVAVPAGRYLCWTYTVTERSDTDTLVSSYSFAKELPGAPIRYASVRNGTSESVTELQYCSTVDPHHVPSL